LDEKKETVLGKDRRKNKCKGPEAPISLENSKNRIPEFLNTVRR
jgi:hypothetical protein